MRVPARRLFLILPLALAACGSSATHRPAAHASICTPQARAAVARFLGLAPATVATTATRATSGAPACKFRARSAGHRVMVAVDVDREPQAYAVFERTVEEASQIFGPVRFGTAPQDIPSIGLDGDWFPDEQHLLTTDGVRLITATVTWPAAKQSQRRALAVAAARPYLGPIHRPTFKSLYG